MGSESSSSGRKGESKRDKKRGTGWRKEKDEGRKEVKAKGGGDETGRGREKLFSWKLSEEKRSKERKLRK